jgi:hypothetical protein
VDFLEIWWAGPAIQRDLDAGIFNTISSTILKWLMLKFVSWRHDVQPCTANRLGLFVCWVIIVGTVWLLGYYCWDCLIVGILLLGLFDCWVIIVGTV